MSRARDQKIDQLLHDAEHKDAAAQLAEMMATRFPASRHYVADARRFRAERNNLVAEAHALDAKHCAPAWKETTLGFLPKPETGE